MLGADVNASGELRSASDVSANSWGESGPLRGPEWNLAGQRGAAATDNQGRRKGGSRGRRGSEEHFLDWLMGLLVNCIKQVAPTIVTSLMLMSLVGTTRGQQAAPLEQATRTWFDPPDRGTDALAIAYVPPR